MIFNVYLICSEFEGSKLYKIGYTRRTPEDRIREFSTGNCSDIYVVDVFKSKWGTRIEASLKSRFKQYNISGEWFRLSNEDVSNFRSYCELYHANIEMLINDNPFYK